MKPNSNMVITNFSVDKTTQELTSVEINGKSFILEPAPTGVSTLYAWLDGGSSRIVYTKTATPSINDIIFAPWEEDGTDVITKDFIVLLVNEDIITYGRSDDIGEAPTAMRYIDGDITL